MSAFLRLPDWPERLDAVIESARHRPFIWGQHDCCLFVADAVAAITGVDFASDWRDQYGDVIDARQLIRKCGFRSFTDLVSVLCQASGWPEITPARAGRGDVCILILDSTEHLCLCTGAHLAVPGDQGLVFYPRSLAQRAWRIGWHVPCAGKPAPAREAC